MANILSGTAKRAARDTRNTLETLGGFGSDITRDVSKIGTGAIDQLLGHYDNKDAHETPHHQSELPQSRAHEFKNIFSLESQKEKKTYENAVEQITEELKLLKKAESSLEQNINDVEKVVINSSKRERKGIYDTSFLQVMLSIIRQLRAKIGESRTWMEALMSKKAKRGSLFAALSKKQGTQYSLSQEIANSRNIQ